MPRKKLGDDSQQFSIRLPNGLKEFIEADVRENDEYMSWNDWIVAAIRHYKSHRVEEIERQRSAGRTNCGSSSENGIDVVEGKA